MLQLRSMALNRVFASILVLLVSLSAQAQQRVWNLPTDIDSMVVRSELILEKNPRTIDISTYEFKVDAIGWTYIASLIQAAQRGTKIRLLIDNKVQKANSALVAYMRKKGIDVRFHNPMAPGWGDIFNPVKGFRRMNRRMHDKMFIVDNRLVVIGDKNYKEKFFYDSLEGKTQELTMVGKEFLLEDERAVPEMTAYFEELWQGEAIYTPDRDYLGRQLERRYDRQVQAQMEWLTKLMERRKELRMDARPSFAYSDFEFLRDTVEVDVSGQYKHSALNKIMSLLREAKPHEKVMIEHSYFVLFPELVDVLQELQMKEVAIHVVLNAPEITDQALIAGALRADLQKMIDLGLKIELITEERRITHAKLIVIGDTVINGSANLDPRSWSINTEMAVKIHSPELAKNLWHIFEGESAFRRHVCETHRCSSEKSDQNYAYEAPGFFSTRPFIEFIRPLL